MSGPFSFRPALSSRRFVSARERVLAQWRGWDSSADEKARKQTSKALGEVMPRILSGLKMERRLTESEILKVWNNLIDPNIATHAQPAGIMRGTLFVNVDSSVWLDEIVRYRRREILERLQTAFGRELITRISFRVGG